MNKYRIVFSPTGGTEKVTNTITKFWNEVKDIDLSKTDLDFSSISFTKKDIAVKAGFHVIAAVSAVAGMVIRKACSVRKKCELYI